MGTLLQQFMNKYPYTDFHELNADWLIKTLMEMINQVENFVSLNAIKYADPIQWDIVRQYEKNTVVIDPLTGTAYISVQPVPSGVALTRTEYWTVVFDLGSFVTRAAKNFTNRYEADTTLTATFASSQGDWLVWGDVLYEALTAINIGDQYVIGTNIRHFTMEEVVNAITAAIGDLDDLPTTDKSSVVNAIIEVVTNLNAVKTKLDNLNIVNVKDFGAVGDGITDDTQAFTDAFAASDVIYVPNGSYLITTGYEVPANKVIIGESVEETVLKLSGAFGIKLDDYDRFENITFLGDACNIIVRLENKTGIKVNNVLVHGINNSGYGFSALNCSKCVIDDLEVYDVDNQGLSTQGLTYSIINKADCHNCGTFGLVIGQGSNVIVSGSRVYDNANMGAVIVNSEYIDICDSLFTNNGYHGISFNTNKHCNYVGCISTGNTYSGFDIYKSYSCKMVGCQSVNNGTMGVEVDSQSYYNTITGCDFRLNGSCGITVYRSARNVITSNSITNNGQRGDLSPDFSATPSGIWVHDDNTSLSRDNIIVGNSIGDDQGTHTQYYGVQVDAGCPSNILQDNVFYSNLVSAVLRYSKSNFAFELYNVGYTPAEQGASGVTMTPYDSDVTSVTGGLYNFNDGVSLFLAETSNITIACNSFNLAAYVPKKLITLSNALGKPLTIIGTATTNALITDGNGVNKDTIIVSYNNDGSLAITSNNSYTGVTQIIIELFNISIPVVALA